MHTITIIPGDGIGPEVSSAARRCIDATGVKIKWEEVEAGEKAFKETGSPLPESVLKSVRKNKIAIKGPIITPIAEGFRSVNVSLRQSLDLFVCLRPAKSYQGVKSRYRNIDIVIFRENTEDLYAGIEFDRNKDETKKIISKINEYQKRPIPQDAAISIKPITGQASERIVDFAFKYAMDNHRKKITVVHKANIMKSTDGLFLNSARKIAQKYQSKILFEEAIVDNMAMQLVTKPWNYDCLVLPNLYGDIISDLCAGLVGGLGIAPGANIGDEIALFEPVHGSAPKYTGQNKVNPTATILSGVLMLRYIGEREAADSLEKAVSDVLREGRYVTYDLKEVKDDPSRVGTQEMADAIIKRIK